MTDITPSGLDGVIQSLPENSGTAALLGMLFMKLGGNFMISDGRRYVGQLEPAAYRMRGEDYPQLPHAEPHEQFLNVEQWRGARRMLSYLLHRLDAADKDFLFDLFAPVSIDPTVPFDFRDQMQ